MSTCAVPSPSAAARGDPPREENPDDAAARQLAQEQARRRELWSRDLAVRIEGAALPPDGSVRTLPTFEYEAGPDGRSWAVDEHAGLSVPEPTPEQAFTIDPRHRSYVERIADPEDAAQPGARLDDVV